MAWSNYRDLLVWQRSMALVSSVYELIGFFPAYEQYSLAAQMRRAAVSVPSNIAEGHGRQTKKEFVNYLYIANGSLAELETQISIAQQQGYITEEQVKPIFQECKEIGLMLGKLIRSINE